MDCHTHFLRDDTRIMGFVRQRQAVGKAGWPASSPQWQIEALRRLEIPEAIQKSHNLRPLGAADGPVKTAIFGDNNARLYKYETRQALATDRIAALKQEYEEHGGQRSNLRYGYVAPERG